MIAKHWLPGFIGVMLLGFPLVVRADDTVSEELPPDFPSVDEIMTRAVRNIAFGYNLNAEQRQKTDELMRREVRRFLQEHHDEVWPMIRSLVKIQLAAGLPDEPDDIKRIGRAAGPLLAKVKKAIFDANAEWREWLNDEQKARHDWDMREMDAYFGRMDENFAQWTQAKLPGQLRLPFPEQVSLEGRPARPSKPTPGIPKQPAVRLVDLDIYDTRVAQFIREYDLDSGQIDAARSILKEFKDDAKAYMALKKTELTKAAEAQREAKKNKDRDAIAKANAAHKLLLKPINELFTKLDERLHRLLTSAQKQRHDAKSKTSKRTSKAARSESPARKQPAKAAKNKKNDQP